MPLFATKPHCVQLVGVTRIAVGTSAIFQVNPIPNTTALSMKYISGGSLEIIGPPPQSASGTYAVTGTSAIFNGLGYLLGTTEVFDIQGSARFFLTATGETAVVGLVYGFSNPRGATLF